MKRLRNAVWVVAIRRALSMLPENRRRRLLLLVIVQMFLGALDLIAVTLVGLMGSLSVSGVQSKEPSGLVADVLSTAGLAGRTLQFQVGAISIVVVVLLLGRTFASIVLTRKALHFLALRTAEASGRLTRRLLAQPLTFVQSHSTQDLIYAVTAGTSSAVLGVLGSVVVMASDLAMLVVLSILLLAVSPIVATALGALMAGIVLLLHRFSTAKAGTLGEAYADVDIAGRNLLIEAFATYRDSVVRGSRPRYAENFTQHRIRGAFVGAEMAFLPNVAKYVLESAVVLAALLVGGIQFAIGDAQSAVSIIAIFLAAGTRLSPAIIRLQQGVFLMKTHLGQAQRGFALFDELPMPETSDIAAALFTTEHDKFVPDVAVDSVTYQYPGAERAAVRDWSLRLKPGQMLALVGPSGAGKSTASDLLLGVLLPSTGTVRISGLSPAEATQRWPGAIGFVPQDVWIADATVRENITLGFAPDEVSDAAVWHALELAQLAEHVRQLPGGLHAQVGERGTQFSGGQRQRLGIARAVVTEPRLLILDEATSALDATTEHDVTEAIRRLQGHMTLIVIAHRLATVRHADVVQYFEDAAVHAQGTFEEVRSAVPQFAAQAQLLGL